MDGNAEPDGTASYTITCSVRAAESEVTQSPASGTPVTIYASLGDADKTFYWLNEAWKVKHPYVQWLPANDAWFGQFKEDPRYKDLLKRLNYEI